MSVVVVDAGSHDVLELGVSAAGGKSILRGQIARDEGAEGLTASEVVSGVDDLLLALEGVASGEIGRVGVAVVAASDGVGYVAAEPYEFGVLVPEVEGNGSDSETYLNTTLLG
jgi:hypothetical protein